MMVWIQNPACNVECSHAEPAEVFTRFLDRGYVKAVSGIETSLSHMLYHTISMVGIAMILSAPSEASTQGFVLNDSARLESGRSQ